MGGIDYDHELSNGWNKYEVMVLQELKRLADSDAEKMAILSNIALNLNTVTARFADHVAASDRTEEDVEGRLRVLETAKNEQVGITRLKQWAIPLVVTVAVSAVGWGIMIWAYLPTRKG